MVSWWVLGQNIDILRQFREHPPTIHIRLERSNTRPDNVSYRLLGTELALAKNPAISLTTRPLLASMNEVILSTKNFLAAFLIMQKAETTNSPCLFS
jgi:hypothetical protein